ncbi:MAG TPA: hypothetical protein VGM60_11410 [Pseudonocardia sp.]|jgi:hypothetical protein|uniref:hypothetical protein n=1 Tax=Pseudonocardia sp. TaxID=60912 RepID=UPI002F3F0E18
MAEVVVSIPDELLEEIDAEAARKATTRAAVLRMRLSQGRLRRDPEVIGAAIARAEELFRDAGPFDSTELVRADRDWRDERDKRR